MFKHVDVCIPSKIEFVKQKWKINRSTLYNFNGANFLHADVCEFLEKFAVDFKYCFLLIFLILKYIKNRNGKGFVVEQKEMWIKENNILGKISQEKNWKWE